MDRAGPGSTDVPEPVLAMLQAQEKQMRCGAAIVESHERERACRRAARAPRLLRLAFRMVEASDDTVLGALAEIRLFVSWLPDFDQLSSSATRDHSFPGDPATPLLARVCLARGSETWRPVPREALLSDAAAAGREDSIAFLDAVSLELEAVNRRQVRASALAATAALWRLAHHAFFVAPATRDDPCRSSLPPLRVGLDTSVVEDLGSGCLGTELALGALERCPELGAVPVDRLASAYEWLHEAASSLLVHATAPAHTHAPRAERTDDLLSSVEDVRRLRGRATSERPEVHAGQVRLRLRDLVRLPSSFVLPEIVELGLEERYTDLYERDPGRTELDTAPDEIDRPERALVTGLNHLRHDARAALTTYQSLHLASDLAAPDFCWLVRATLARFFLAGSRALALSSLLPSPEGWDEVCPVHGVRHAH